MFMDIVGVIVLTLIGVFAFKCYRLDAKNKKYMYFALAFFVLATGFFFKILTNFTLYYTAVKTQQVGVYMLTYQEVKQSDVLFDVGLLVYRLLTLLGLYWLYVLYYPKQEKFAMFLQVCFILAVSYFLRQSYHIIFHFISLLFLGLITWHYYKIYCKTKDCLGKYLLMSFVVLALSQLLLMLFVIHPFFYQAGEIVQLIGYVGLAATFFMVRRYGKKAFKN